MREWLKWLLMGGLSVAFGVIVLGNTVAASMAVATVTGALFVLAGIVQGLGTWRAERMIDKIFSLGIGLLMLVVGGAFLLDPLGGTISLALLILILLIASGSIRLFLAWRMREASPFFWPMLLSGALTLLLAGVIAANFSTASVNLLGILLGVELLFNGAGLIIMAFFLRRAGR